jgi:hypothetical protein
MTCCTANRRAFATTTALMLLALVGVALSAMALRLTTVARQTRQTQEAAQIRQLLLAGTQFARASPGDGEHFIELPSALKASGAKLIVRMKGREGTVEASIGDRPVAQTVTFAADGAATVRLVE